MAADTVEASATPGRINSARRFRPSLEIGRQASYINRMFMQISANKFSLPARFNGLALLLGLLLPC